LASTAVRASADAPFPNPFQLSPPRPAERRSSNAGSEIFGFFPGGVVHIARATVAGREPADWGALAAPDRASILYGCADALRAEAEGLAHLETLETRRPIRATAADVSAAIAGFEEASRLARAMGKVRIELGGGRTEERRHAAGSLVVAALHWSRPVLELGALARALAHGDELLLQPDPRAARTIAKVVALLVRAGLPEGALTIVSGEAQRDPEDDDGARFGRTGPKGATVVLPGADLERAARSAVRGSRAWTGSTFASQSRIHVHQSVHRRFTEACGAAAAALRLGDPLALETEVGPLLSREHGQWIEDLLATDLRAGASVVTGGKRLVGAPSEPPLFAPTVIDGCRAASALARAESFAPIVVLQSFDHDDEVAVELGKGRPAEALGVFAGDPERAGLLVAACDRTLNFVNDDGLSESERAWWSPGLVDPGAPRLRRTILAGQPVEA
jgi:betaine-aldehyde dehydrogenase